MPPSGKPTPNLLVEVDQAKIRRYVELRAQLAQRTSRDPSNAPAWVNDPAVFAEQCITWPGNQCLAAYQAEILHELPNRRRVAVRGPHGLGKTTLNAIAVLWFACSRDWLGADWKIATTAGAWRQLEHYLWPEIKKWAKRIRWDVVGRLAWNERTEMLALNLKLATGSGFAVASDNPALIEGVHADHVLYIFDESKAIVAAIFDAAEGAFSGAGANHLEAYALACSTPGEPNGRFYDIHARKPGLEDWWTRHVTVDEAIAAGRINADWVEARKRQWGETSALFANRVLGEFHTADEDGVIPLAWAEAAIERGRQLVDVGLLTRLGVDVARSGADKTVLAPIHDRYCLPLRYFTHADTMETTGRVAAALESGATAVVDVIGVGAGVVDRLREQHLNVIAFNASAGTDTKDASGELGFTNCRSAAWWHLRELLDPNNPDPIALPDDDLLLGDLTAPHWRVMSGGRIQVEPKDDIKRRIGRSTDSGDAVVMGFWQDYTRGTAWMEHMRRVAEQRGITVEVPNWRDRAPKPALLPPGAMTRAH